MSGQDLIPTYSREDIEFIVNSLVDYFNSVGSGSNSVLEVRYDVARSTYTIDVLRYIDLDAVASGTAGVFDPLGQLRDWLVSQFAWVGDAIKNFFKPILDGISGGVSWIRDRVGWIYDNIVSIASTIKDVIVTPINQALNWVSTNFPKLVDTVTSLLDKAGKWISDVGGKIQEAFTTIGNMLSSAGDKIGKILTDASNWIQNFGSQLQDAINKVSNFISQASSNIQGMLSKVSEWVGNVGSAIDNIFSNIKSWIDKVSSGFKDLIDRVGSGMAGLGKLIEDSLSKISSWISSISKSVEDVIGRITSAFTTFASKVEDAFSAVSKWISGIQSTVSGALDTIGKWVRDIGGTAQNTLSNILDLFSKASSSITSMISTATDKVSALLGSVAKGAEDIATKMASIPDAVGKLLENVGKSVSNVLDSIKWFFTSFSALAPEALETISPDLYREWVSLVSGIKTPIDYLMRFPQVMWLFIKTTGALVWYFIPKEVRDWFDNVNKALIDVGARFQGFVNAILKFPEWFEIYVKSPIDSIKDALGGLVNLIKSPIEALGKSVIDALGKAVGFVFDSLKNLGTAIASRFLDIVKSMIDQVSKVGEGLLSITTSFVGGLIGRLSKAVDEATKAFSSMIKYALDKVSGAVSDTASKVLDSIVSRFGQIGYLEEIKGKLMVDFGEALNWTVLITSSVVLAQIALRFIAFYIRGVGIAFAQLLPRIDLLPFGIGAEFHIGRAIRDTMWGLANILEDWSNEVIRGVIYGGAIWLSRPLTKFFTASFRNVVPIELPSLEMIVEAVRRSMPTAVLPKRVEMTQYYMALYGYSDEVISWFKVHKNFLPEKVSEVGDYVAIKDRFNKDRYIPTSLVFELPSASEMVRMMVRDVVIDPEHFIKMIAMRGVSKDVSLMYYLLHFRYPPPEKLWSFYTRALAGMLWYEPPSPARESPIWQDVFQLIDTYGIGSEYIPLKPVDLNVTSKEIHDKHLEALTRYFKWHDYAPFSWTPKYTSDRFIMFDLMADIPTKIDMRWMVRWALFEQMGRYVADITKFTIDEVVDIMSRATGTELVSAKPTGRITFDVRLFAKLLQATGLHPYWVPVVAVAEAINALADERTLLRTGILNMYKEGLIDINISEQLMSGLFVTEFRTAVFDTATATWSEVNWKVPVAWLPAERTLMQMRSVFDRVLDIYREFYRAIISGIRALVLEPDEGRNLIKSFTSSLLKFASSELKTLTGIDTPLAIDERYMELWIDYASVLRDLESKERIRMWMYRLVAWLFYRVSYGWVTDQDLDKVLNILKEKAFLSKYEAEAIKAIMSEVSGIVGREYIPTPTQLATIVEYVPDAIKHFEAVMRVQRVPSEWWDVWKSYIYARSLKSDAKSLLSVYVRAYRYGAVSKDEMLKFIESIKKYGFSSEEVKFMLKRVELEELIEEVREVSRTYLPTPSMLATLSEYIELPTETIRGVLEKRNVPKEWIDIWMRYISVRPIKSDFKSLLTVASRALALGVIGNKYWEEYKKRARDHGFTDREVGIIDERVKLEEKIDNVRRYRQLFEPTPSFLATILEYVDTSEINGFRDFMEGYFNMLAEIGVPHQILSAVRSYVENRPVKSDYRSLLSTALRAYRIGVIDDKKWNEYLSNAKLYGFTKREIDVLVERANLEIMIESFTEYLPSPTTLATLSEYMTLPSNLVRGVLEGRKLPKEWVDIWIKYIEVRPIKSDAKTLLSTYIRAMRYGAVSKSDVDSFISELRKYGFTDREIDMIRRRVDLEALIEESREYVPTPSQLAIMAEYVPEVRDLMTKVFDARKVPKEWRDVWARYIALRPVVDDVRRYLTSVERLYEYFLIGDDILKNVLNSLTKYGYESEEITLIINTESLDRIYRAFVSVIGSPRNLTVMSRYSPEARDMAYSYAVKMIDALPVDDATKKLLKSMWEHYVRHTSVYEDLRAYINELVTAYAYYAIDDATLDSELNQLKAFGLSDERIQLIKRRAKLRRARQEAYWTLSR